MHVLEHLAGHDDVGDLVGERQPQDVAAHRHDAVRRARAAGRSPTGRARRGGGPCRRRAGRAARRRRRGRAAGCPGGVACGHQARPRRGDPVQHREAAARVPPGVGEVVVLRRVVPGAHGEGHASIFARRRRACGGGLRGVTSVPAAAALVRASHPEPTVAVTAIATALAVSTGLGARSLLGRRGLPDRPAVRRLEQRLDRRGPRRARPRARTSPSAQGRLSVGDGADGRPGRAGAVRPAVARHGARRRAAAPGGGGGGLVLQRPAQGHGAVVAAVRPRLRRRARRSSCWPCPAPPSRRPGRPRRARCSASAPTCATRCPTSRRTSRRACAGCRTASGAAPVGRLAPPCCCSRRRCCSRSARPARPGRWRSSPSGCRRWSRRSGWSRSRRDGLARRLPRRARRGGPVGRAAGRPRCRARARLRRWGRAPHSLLAALLAGRPAPDRLLRRRRLDADRRRRPARRSTATSRPASCPSGRRSSCTDTEGERYDFAERTGGRPTLLYFGYTSCPDECPTAMADIAGALRGAEPAGSRGRPAWCS